MKILVISGNPKKNGLCDSIVREMERGAADGGAQVERLQIGKLERCRVCGDGWGICREQNRCAFGKDGFDDAHGQVKQADAYILVTPVYWHEMAEGLKSFIDKLRRCEFGEEGALAGKPVLMAASAGGTGNGILPCLEQMDRFCRHTGAGLFDYIGVNRWNNDYKKAAAYAAARAMAEGRAPGDTI